MVNNALKQRLLQQFQQKQQQESIAAQASRAAEPSDDHAKSSGGVPASPTVGAQSRPQPQPPKTEASPLGRPDSLPTEISRAQPR